MAKPLRNSSRQSIVAGVRTFFVSSRTVQGKHLLQSQRFAELLIDVLRSYTLAGKCPDTNLYCRRPKLLVLVRRLHWAQLSTHLRQKRYKQDWMHNFIASGVIR